MDLHSTTTKHTKSLKANGKKYFRTDETTRRWSNIVQGSSAVIVRYHLSESRKSSSLEFSLLTNIQSAKPPQLDLVWRGPELQTIGTSRYSPFEKYGRVRILKRDKVNLNNATLFNDEEIPIEREEVHLRGDVARRDLTLEALALPEKSPPPCTLIGCFKKGVVDMASVGRLLHDMKQNQTFSEGSYREFVRHVATHNVKRFSYNGFKLPNHASLDTFAEAAELLSDVMLAKSTFFERKLLSSLPDPNELPSHSNFRVENCSKSWILEANAPFLKVDLRAISFSWDHKRHDSNFAQSMSLFRYLLKRITDPPDKIKEYALRVSGRRGKDATLKNLPENVESTLIDFAEDMLGYGKEELKLGVEFDRSKSSFFLSLGRSDDEREEVLQHLMTERSLWRRQLFKSLQRALTDVRSKPIGFGDDWSCF